MIDVTHLNWLPLEKIKFFNATKTHFRRHKTKTIIMKVRLTLFFILFISVFTVKAHDKISFQNKESFNAACTEGKVCSHFNLIEIKDKNDLKQASQFIKENESIIQMQRRETYVELTVQSSTDIKLIYQKLFHELGLQEIEILEGDAKGVYSVEEFLKLYF